MGVVGYLSVNAGQRALQKTIGEKTAILILETLDEIYRDIYKRIEIFQEYSQNSELLESVCRSNQEFEKLEDIDTYLKQKDGEWIKAPKETITPFMRDILNSELSQALRQKIAFYEIKNNYKLFGEVFVTNKYGANVVQSGKTSDYMQNDEIWWQETRARGLFVADVAYDESADVYSTDIGIRIDDAEGNFAGVMKVVLNIEEITKIIRSIAEYETAGFKLFNKKGRVLYDDSGEYAFWEDVSDKKFFSRMQDDYGYFLNRGRTEGKTEELITYARKSKQKNQADLGWILLINYDTGTIFAPIVHLRNRLLIISLTVTILAVSWGLYVSRHISRPVASLCAAAQEIGKGNLQTPIEIKSGDEMGQLASTLQKMAENLKKSTTSVDNLNREIAEHKKSKKELREIQEQLVATSHKAGMAEVATGVLHNVGNVLNSVNVSAQLISEKLANSEIRNLEKVIDIINENIEHLNVFISQDPKGKYIPLYLSEVTKLLTAEQDKITDMVHSLTKNINHIKEIVKMQQSYAKVSGVEVNTTLTELVEDALEINIAGLTRHGIEVIREYEDLPQVSIDKQKVLQILVNLISNSKYSLSNNDSMDKRLTLRVRKQDENNVCIQVCDNGIGISQENLTNIFQHGFTTKRQGHGFGLHSGAIAAKELGGSLTVQSEGVDRGATFTLILPLKIVEFTSA